MRRPSVPTLLCGAAAATLLGCSVPSPAPNGTPAPTREGWQTEAVATLGATPAPVPLSIGLPFRPDVQFAPWYVAAARGYFAEGGYSVSFEYGDESAFVRRVAARDGLAAMVASGEQVILARAKEIPVTYVATWYQRFPVVVVSTTGIGTPADLVGRTVGLPAPSGASFLGWQALLGVNDIDPSSVTTEVIGFTQTECLQLGRCDAAVGYAANEPVQLRAQGLDVSVIEIADSFNLVSNGLIVAQGVIDDSPDTVAALVRGFLRGLADTLADPDAAFEIALDVVPEAADPAVRDVQRQVLAASLPYWDAPELGAIDAAAWARSAEFLVAQGLIDEAPSTDELIEPRFVDAAGVSR